MRRLLERGARAGLLAWARLERRVRAWSGRAARALLLAEHPGVVLGSDVRLEEHLLFRIGREGRLEVGAGSRLRRGSEFKSDGRLSFGCRVHVGPDCTFSALAAVTLGDDCLIAERVSIRDHDHAIADPARPYHAQGYAIAPVTIGRNVWIGAGVTIVKGVTLGDNCVVGANAVVTHSFPANSLVAGVPARLIRTLAPGEGESLSRGA